MRRHQILVLSGLTLAGVLPGCATPVMMASQAVSGISYLTTGKGTTDHVISAAADEDCALHRVLTTGVVCTPETDPTQVAQTASLADVPLADDEFFSRDESDAADHGVQVAMMGPIAPSADAAREAASHGNNAVPVLGLGADAFFVPDSEGTATGPVMERRNDVAVSGEKMEDMAPAAGTPAPLPPVATRATVPAEPKAQPRLTTVVTAKPQFYLVLGSYSKRGGAERAAASAALSKLKSGTATKVVPATVNKRMVYRVVVGPFDRDHTLSTRRQLAQAGLSRSWPVPACGAATARGCISTD